MTCTLLLKGKKFKKSVCIRGEGVIQVNMITYHTEQTKNIDELQRVELNHITFSQLCTVFSSNLFPLHLA